jgi:hypothetical protein
MPSALGPWRFLGRWITIAFENSLSRTGTTPATVVYGGLGAAIGFYACLRSSGPTPAFVELLKTWVLFTAVGSVMSWGVAMFISIITAPFHMHRFDYEAFAREQGELDREYKATVGAIHAGIADLGRQRDAALAERDSLAAQLKVRHNARELREALAALIAEGCDIRNKYNAAAYRPSGTSAASSAPSIAAVDQMFTAWQDRTEEFAKQKIPALHSILLYLRHSDTGLVKIGASMQSSAAAKLERILKELTDRAAQIID